jgi:hypothetical protein
VWFLKPSLGEIRDEWPWWDDLHSFWRELPNYNPIGVQSSEPGTDHAAEAEQLFQVPSAVVSSDDEHEDDGNSAASGLQEDRGSEYQDPVSDGDEDGEDSDVSCQLVSLMFSQYSRCL